MQSSKIFVTGSSSRMLSREMGTKLTGRHVSLEVFPLSFAEYLRFNNIHIDTELDYLNRKSAVRNLFLEYMRYGGFPEVTLNPEIEAKELLLKHYFDDILYRDIAARHEIRDTLNLRNLAVYLLTNIARPTSTNKLKKNFAISQDKTENYISAILESYLLFQLQKFSFSLKNTLRAGFKPYAIDTGLRNRVAFSFSSDTGWLAENLVFGHLRRKHEEIYFQKNANETDFIVKQGLKITRHIQVWYADTAQTAIPARELACFDLSDTDNAPAERILITNDIEDIFDTGNAQIHYIPIVKFLLFDAA
jgi:uncharacterized protein